MMVFGYVEGTSKLAKGNNLLVIPDREGIIVYKDGLYGVISSSGRTLLPIQLKKVYRELVNGKSTYYMVYGDDNKTENILEFWNKTIGTVSNKDNTTVTNNVVTNTTNTSNNTASENVADKNAVNTTSSN
ncbi:unknown [Clostridium sp. CAG:571]|nr:unknown [Clostridium sp. CAG:571]